MKKALVAAIMSLVWAAGPVCGQAEIIEEDLAYFFEMTARNTVSLSMLCPGNAVSQEQMADDTLAVMDYIAALPLSKEERAALLEKYNFGFEDQLDLLMINAQLGSNMVELDDGECSTMRAAYDNLIGMFRAKRWTRQPPVSKR